jgi:peptide/nickel transport system ATP-binding protein
VVERGRADDVILRPQDEYTRRLRDASPDPDRHFARPDSTAPDQQGAFA